MNEIERRPPARELVEGRLGRVAAEYGTVDASFAAENEGRLGNSVFVFISKLGLSLL